MFEDSLSVVFNKQNILEKATRTTLTSRTLIDIIVTTRKDLVNRTYSHWIESPLGISELRLRDKRPQPKYRKTRDYKRLEFRYDISRNRTFSHLTGFWRREGCLMALIQYTTLFAMNTPHWKKSELEAHLRAPWITNAIRYKMNRR